MSIIEILQDIMIDIEEILKSIIIDFGIPGVIIVMIIQAIIAPIPSEFILGITGTTFMEKYGFPIGLYYAIFSLTIGSLLGATAAYYIGNSGSLLSAKYIDLQHRNIKIAQTWLQQHGLWAVLVGRFLPFIPFDGISYAAGITHIKFSRFIIATFVGVIPRIIFYTWGYTIFSSWLRNQFEIAITFVGILISVLLVLYWLIFVKISQTKDYPYNENLKEEGKNS